MDSPTLSTRLDNVEKILRVHTTRSKCKLKTLLILTALLLLSLCTNGVLIYHINNTTNQCRKLSDFQESSTEIYSEAVDYSVAAYK